MPALWERITTNGLDVDTRQRLQRAFAGGDFCTPVGEYIVDRVKGRLADMC